MAIGGLVLAINQASNLRSSCSAKNAEKTKAKTENCVNVNCVLNR